VFLTFRLDIRDDNNLDMPDFFRLPAWLGAADLLAFGHHEHLGLRLATCAALQRLAFLFRHALRGEKALVYLHASAKQVFAVALAHDTAQFVEHLPYRLVTLVSELPLKLVDGESPLRCRQHVHGEEPVSEGELGVQLSNTVPLCRLARCWHFLHS